MLFWRPVPLFYILLRKRQKLEPICVLKRDSWSSWNMLLWMRGLRWLCIPVIPQENWPRNPSLIFLGNCFVCSQTCWRPWSVDHECSSHWKNFIEIVPQAMHSQLKMRNSLSRFVFTYRSKTLWSYKWRYQFFWPQIKVLPG